MVFGADNTPHCSPLTAYGSLVPSRLTASVALPLTPYLTSPGNSFEAYSRFTA